MTGLSCRQTLWLHCGSETKALAAVIYLHIISMLYSNTVSWEEHTHTLRLISTSSYTLNDMVCEWINPKLVTFCLAMSQRSWLTLTSAVGVARCQRFVAQTLGISTMFPDTHTADLTSHIHMSFPPAHSCRRKAGGRGGLSSQGSLTPTLFFSYPLFYTYSVSSTCLSLETPFFSFDILDPCSL